MSVVENNKLIAEFMGHEILYRPYSNGFIELSDTQLCDVDDLLYHKSWEWLMPVVEKIEEIASEDVPGSHKIHRFNVRIEGVECEITDRDPFFATILEDGGEKKDNVYTAVVEFIKIYNRHA